MSFITVPVRVEHGSVYSVDGTPLPESASALLVLLPAQNTVLDASAAGQREDAFARFYASVYQHAQAIHLDDLSDEQLNELVHTARLP